MSDCLLMDPLLMPPTVPSRSFGISISGTWGISNVSFLGFMSDMLAEKRNILLSGLCGWFDVSDVNATSLGAISVRSTTYIRLIETCLHLSFLQLIWILGFNLLPIPLHIKLNIIWLKLVAFTREGKKLIDQDLNIRHWFLVINWHLENPFLGCPISRSCHLLGLWRIKGLWVLSSLEDENQEKLAPTFPTYLGFSAAQWPLWLAYSLD